MSSSPTPSPRRYSMSASNGDPASQTAIRLGPSQISYVSFTSVHREPLGTDAHPHDGCCSPTGELVEEWKTVARSRVSVGQADSGAREVSRARKAGLRPRKEEEWR